jgi:NADP-dependent 3-hydroxy acid dehydrogenase YdfG
MLSPEDVAATIVDVAASPAGLRIDEIRLMPKKGIL